MDKNTDLMNRFFQKTHDDERLLTTRHPQIVAMLQLAGAIPPQVLDNYNIARNECQERIGFTSMLMRQYADPMMGSTTPAPDNPSVQLPLFVPKDGSSSFVPKGGGLAGTMAMVSAKDVVIVGRGGMVLDPGQQPAPSGALGLPFLVPVAYVIGGIIVTAIAAYYIGKGAGENEVKLAEQKVELVRQANFAKVWDSTNNLVVQCIGVNPTPDRIKKCWEDITTRFPAIINAIPDHKMSATGGGMGVFGTIGIIVAIGATVAGGIWIYGRVQEARERREQKAAREEERQERREERTGRLPAPGMAGAGRHRRRA